MDTPASSPTTSSPTRLRRLDDETAIARVALRRILQILNALESPSDLPFALNGMTYASLAGLAFAGTRTVAHLLGEKHALSGEAAGASPGPACTWAAGTGERSRGDQRASGPQPGGYEIAERRESGDIEAGKYSEAGHLVPPSDHPPPQRPLSTGDTMRQTVFDAQPGATIFGRYEHHERRYASLPPASVIRTFSASSPGSGLRIRMVPSSHRAVGGMSHHGRFESRRLCGTMPYPLHTPLLHGSRLIETGGEKAPHSRKAGSDGRDTPKFAR